MGGRCLRCRQGAGQAPVMPGARCPAVPGVGTEPGCRSAVAAGVGEMLWWMEGTPGTPCEAGWPLPVLVALRGSARHQSTVG